MIPGLEQYKVSNINVYIQLGHQARESVLRCLKDSRTSKPKVDMEIQGHKKEIKKDAKQKKKWTNNPKQCQLREGSRGQHMQKTVSHYQWCPSDQQGQETEKK